MNWRKPIIETLLFLTGNDMMSRYRRIKQWARRPREEIKQLQENRLKDLLVYAYRNVPYYHRMFEQHHLVEESGKVNLENWSRIPFLTKDIIRRRFHDLVSRTASRRHCYENTSGGSTGEPVKFIQDRDYKIGDMAAHVFFSNFSGKEIGEPELKLWGSQRDVFEGSLGTREKLQNFLYNRLLLNSFRMEYSELSDYIKKWNAFRPKVVWAYVDSIYEITRYIEEHSIEVYPPKAVIATAGTLFPQMRTRMEKVLKTRVLNQYGSREVGAIACECMEQNGLHMFEWKHLLEIVDAEGRVCPPGEEGEIVITNLENYSMPLVRFKIEDTGAWSETTCSCEYNLSLLENVTGRITDHFIRRDGSLFHGQYFGFLLFYTPWVKKFQFVQKDYDLVKVYIVLAGEKDPEKLKFVEEKTKLVLDKDCRVEFEFVEEIPPTKSGKFLYTVSEVFQRKRQSNSEKAKG